MFSATKLQKIFPPYEHIHTNFVLLLQMSLMCGEQVRQVWEICRRVDFKISKFESSGRHPVG